MSRGSGRGNVTIDNTIPITGTVDVGNLASNESEFLLRALLAAIRDPVWLDMATNAQRALLVSGSTTAVTGSLTTAGTVSTVTDITNIGANPANLMPINMSEISWGLTTRGLLI
jgi:hypothetical protein